MSLTNMATQRYEAVEDPGDLQASMIQAVHDMNGARYIGAIGMVLLLYDHLLTMDESIDFIKNSARSPEKAVFLLNRYLVPLSQICIAVFINHFDGGDFSALSCQIVISVTFVVGIFSIAGSNVLAIWRVISLWDRDHLIIKVLAYGFVFSFLTTVAFAIRVLYRSIPGITYISYLHSCASSIKAPLLPGVWAPSFAFETMVLVLVVYNALSRPRGQNTRLRHVLYRDGIAFFVTLASLRFFNLIISFAARPTVVMSGLYFNWALTTLVLNRSLLNIHKAGSEVGRDQLTRDDGRKGSRQTTDRDVEDYPLPALGDAAGTRRYSGQRMRDLN